MHAPRFPTATGSPRWIATLVALAGVGALSIDMSLPAQPILAERFHASDGAVQLTLSMFLVGFGLAQLVVGYLSDAVGRRPVLLAGLALFTASSVACALSTSIEMLIVCRALQGIGAAAAPTLARAMVRDVQPGAQAARLLSTMLAAVAIAPMIAPTIGSTVLAVLGWRAIFALLAACSATLLAIVHASLRETLPAQRRAALSLRGLAHSYAKFFTTPGTRLPLLVACAAFAGQFAYIAASPFVYLAGYHASPLAYGCYFGATALALMLGSLTGRRVLRDGRSPHQLIAIGTMVLVAGAFLLAIGTRFHGLGVAGFLGPMIVYFFGCGLTSPSATALAMTPVPDIAGTASAAIGFSIAGAGALSGYETTRLGATTPRVFASVVIAMAVLSAIFAWAALYLRSERKPVHGRRVSRETGTSWRPIKVAS